jgi:sporulation protein YlmC with PRC-barrel domain
MMAQAGSVLSASTLSGDKVRNLEGEDLGKIEDFMLDIDSGRIAYAVLSFGGALGVGNKLFAVPAEALQIDKKEHCFVLDADKDALKDAPGFDRDDWPDFADKSWGMKVHSYYGRTPYWT